MNQSCLLLQMNTRSIRQTKTTWMGLIFKNGCMINRSTIYIFSPILRSITPTTSVKENCASLRGNKSRLSFFEVIPAVSIFVMPLQSSKLPVCNILMYTMSLLLLSHNSVQLATVKFVKCSQPNCCSPYYSSPWLITELYPRTHVRLCPFRPSFEHKKSRADHHQTTLLRIKTVYVIL